MRFTACLIVVALAAIVGYRYACPHRSPEETVVREWFGELLKGNAGRQYLAATQEYPVPTLFAVQSCEIVDTHLPEFVVRIHSSTQAGLPIVRNYYVEVRDEKITCVMIEGEAEKHFQQALQPLDATGKRVAE